MGFTMSEAPPHMTNYEVLAEWLAYVWASNGNVISLTRDHGYFEFEREIYCCTARLVGNKDYFNARVVVLLGHVISPIFRSAKRILLIEDHFLE
jgi:hypothetical protein